MNILKFTICCLFTFFFALNVGAQRKIKVLEQSLVNATGFEKIGLYNAVIDHHLKARNMKKAENFAIQAELYIEELLSDEDFEMNEEDLKLNANTLFKIGEVYKARNYFVESKEVLDKVILFSDEWDLSDILEKANTEIENIEFIIESDGDKEDILENTFREIGDFFSKTTDETQIAVALKMARIFENKREYENALKQYGIALRVSEEIGKVDQAEDVKEKIVALNQTIEEEGSYQKSRPFEAPPVEKRKKVETLDQLGRSEPGEVVTTPQTTPVRPAPNPVIRTPKVVIPKDVGDIRTAAQRAESNQDYAASLDYYKQYMELEKSVQEERAQQQLVMFEQATEIENRDKAIKLYKQDKKIAELEIAKKEADLTKQKYAKRNFGIGLGLLGSVLLSLYWMFFNKKKAHQKLGLAYNELKTTQDNLKNAQVKIKNLLQQQVSGAVADELLASTGVQKIERRFVCIMFLDIRDFTVFAENKNPEEIIDYQNEIFGFMMESITRNNGIVNQILGDGFMATFGAPHSSGQDCHDAYIAAQEIISTVDSKSASGEIPPTKVGIGLHAGYVVAGNVGTQNRKQYSITGNPVIIASRLEQLNKTFGSSIVISKNVYDQLPEVERTPMDFNEVSVKGRTEPVEVAAI